MGNFSDGLYADGIHLMGIFPDGLFSVHPVCGRGLVRGHKAFYFILYLLCVEGKKGKTSKMIKFLVFIYNDVIFTI